MPLCTGPGPLNVPGLGFVGVGGTAAAALAAASTSTIEAVEKDKQRLRVNGMLGSLAAQGKLEVNREEIGVNRVFMYRWTDKVVTESKPLSAGIPPVITGASRVIGGPITAMLAS